MVAGFELVAEDKARLGENWDRINGFPARLDKNCERKGKC